MYHVPPNAQSTQDRIPVEWIWQQYKATGDEDLRNQLMERYLFLVKFTADRIYAKVPHGVELDDLHSTGVLGLMRAIESFDLDRGVKFETYCASRIRGAILDELRATDWVPRLVRNRTAQIENARQQLEMQRGYAPSIEEIAQHMGLAEREFEKVCRDAGPVGVVSLNRGTTNDDSTPNRVADSFPDPRQPNPLRQAQKRDLREVIWRGLNRSERLILMLYYYEQMTMKEIGLVLDLSESRVSQMHTSILDRLKARLGGMQDELQNPTE